MEFHVLPFRYRKDGIFFCYIIKRRLQQIRFLFQPPFLQHVSKYGRNMCPDLIFLFVYFMGCCAKIGLVAT